MPVIRLFGRTIVAATPPTLEEDPLGLALALPPAKNLPENPPPPALPSPPPPPLPPTPPPAEDPVLSWLATFDRAPVLVEPSKPPPPPPPAPSKDASSPPAPSKDASSPPPPGTADTVVEAKKPKEVEVEDRKEKAWPPLPPRGRAIWHYTNPRGQCKGPYSVTALRSWEWRDPCPRVWRRGSSPGDSIRLSALIDYYDEAASAGDVRQWMFDDMNGGPRSLDELRRRIARRQLQPGLKVWILGQPKERVMLSDLLDDVDVAAAPEDKAVKDKEIKMPKRVEAAQDHKEEERRKRWTRREAEAEAERRRAEEDDRHRHRHRDGDRRRAEEDDRDRHRHRHRDRDRDRGKAPRQTPSPPRGSGASCSEPRGRPRMPMRMR